MRRQIAGVLGSLVLTLSMVVVWPSVVGSVAPWEGTWTGAGTALADDEDPKPGWYEVGKSDSGRPIYRYFNKRGWVSYTTKDPWMFPLILSFVQQLWGWSEYTARLVTLILFRGLIDPDDERRAQLPQLPPPTGEPVVFGPVTPSIASDGTCEARFYRGTPTVKVKGTTGKGKPKIARADLWVDEDCSVRMELVWQAAGLIKGWCHILVASGTGTSTPRSVFPQTLEGAFDGGTTAIDLACPAKDCPGRIEWLNGGNREAGQVGAYLVPTQTGLGDGTTFHAEVVEDGTLKVAPLTFENSYMVFKVKRIFAESTEPPPYRQKCPSN